MYIMPGQLRDRPVCGQAQRIPWLVATSWDNDGMPNATITVDSALKERLEDLATQSGQRVDEFVGALLRRIADADVRFDRGVPVFPRRPGAPTLSIEDVDRLADGTGE